MNTLLVVSVLIGNLVSGESLRELLATCNKAEVCKLMNQSQPTMESLSQHKTDVYFTLHSHLDAFWLQSYDQYIQGTGSDGMHAFACTNCMYSGVLESLKSIPGTTYMVAEVCFFKPWFEQLGEEDKETVRGFVQEGRLDIVNGGWVQNDEACANYQDVILQMSVGHHYVHKTFGFIPQISFNIDGFGHSSVQTAVNYLSGMKGQIIERLDTQDIFSRAQRRALEFQWHGGPQSINFLEPETAPNLLTHTRFRRHGPFRFHGKQFAQVKTPGNGFCMQVFQQLKDFERLLYMQKTGSISEQMMFHFGGDDFQYFNQSLYESQDLIVQFYSMFECRSINVTWSTASRYFAELPRNDSIEHKYGDFFPYWEDGLYWTAFYTTFPEFKLFVRQAALFQQTLSFYVAQGRLSSSSVSPFQFSEIIQHLQTLREEVALAQHHDGITGTSKYWVHEDVVKRLQSAMDRCRKDHEFLTKSMYFTDSSDEVLLIGNNRDYQKSITKSQASIVECSLISESKGQCLMAILSTRRMRARYGQVYADETLRILLYNPHAAHRRMVELSLPKDVMALTISDSEGKPLQQEIRCWPGGKDCSIAFLVDLPGYFETVLLVTLGTSTNDVNYYALIPELDFQQEMLDNEVKAQSGEPIVHEQDLVQSSVYESDGLNFMVLVEKEGIDYQHEFLINTCPKGQIDHICIKNFVLSYLFYPNLSTKSWNYWAKKSFQAQAGKYVMMNNADGGRLSCQYNQAYKLERYSELSLPIVLKCGKIYSTTITLYPWNLEDGIDIDTQMFANFQTAQQGDYVMQVVDQQLTQPTNGEMYTDTAGWFMMYRKNNQRENYEPVYNTTDRINGNVYPITAYAAITDAPPNEGQFRGNTMILLTDRAQGVFTIMDKSLELLLEHFGADDGQGVGETCSKKIDNFYHNRIIFRKMHELARSPLCLRCIWHRWQLDAHRQNIRISDPMPFYKRQVDIPSMLDDHIRLEMSFFEESSVLHIENLQELVPENSQSQYQNVDYDDVLNREIKELVTQPNQILAPLFQNSSLTYSLKKAYLNGIPLSNQEQVPEDSILRPLEINAFEIIVN